MCASNLNVNPCLKLINANLSHVFALCVGLKCLRKEGTVVPDCHSLKGLLHPKMRILSLITQTRKMFQTRKSFVHLWNII